MHNPQMETPSLAAGRIEVHQNHRQSEDITASNLSNVFEYSRGSSKYDNAPNQRVANSWDEFKNAIWSDKSAEKGSTFICATMVKGRHNKPDEYQGENTWRQKHLTGRRNWQPFDIDFMAGPEAFGAVREFFAQFNTLCYTTDTSTDELPRARMVVQCSRPMKSAESEIIGVLIEEKAVEAIGAARVKFDKSVYGGWQPCYLPTVRSKRYDLNGDVLDVDAWLAQATPVKHSRAKNISVGNQARAVAISENDPVIQRLNERGMVKGQAAAGTFNIVCPCEDQHTSESGESSVQYRLPNFAGVKYGKFICLHEHCRERPQEQFIEAIGLNPKIVWAQQNGRGLPADAVEFDDLADDLTEALLNTPNQDNVALAFRRQHEGKLLYVKSFGAWLEWDGTRWKREDTDKAFDYVRTLARKISAGKKASLSSASFCHGVESFARADRAFATGGDDFDQENYFLNTPAGTFDLRNNVLRQHDPLDRITLRTSVSPSPEGGARFRQFLREVTGGDVSLSEFLQVSLGACLSGAVESHWMLFWTGAGRNGKNTLGDLVMDVIGDYGRKIPASTLMAKSHEAHPTELASLRGVRLATASEVSDGDHWHEARINELTGDATISARFMRGDFFQFQRTHKHLIYGNHRPQLRSVTEALKARIKIVPFSQSFIGREDPMLPEKLRLESSYVLHWLLEGHAKWVQLGRKLPPCDAVSKESENYFAEQSTVDMWIKEELVTLAKDDRPAYDCPKSSDLYRIYTYWKKERGESPVSQTRWGEAMRRFDRVKSNGVRYRGVRLLHDFDTDVTDLI